jgi:putative peptidoglycan lipid II flippase
MSLLKSGILVSFNTLLSRIAGYIRDIFIASYLGTSHLGDIFAVAYRLPNFFRALFAEGAFSSTFVPSLSATIIKEGKDASFMFASNIMTILLIFLSSITLLIYIFLPEVMLLVAPGYADNAEKFSQLVYASSITLPYMIFICLCSLITSLLNSHDKFFMGSFLPIIANLIMIFFIVFLSPFFANSMIALCY